MRNYKHVANKLSTNSTHFGVFPVCVIGTLLFFTLFCDPGTPVSPDDGADSPGMVKISSRNDTVVLGSTHDAAKIDEQPVTSSVFTYDFRIDTCEITIADYYAVTGSLPLEYDSVGVSDSLLPVTYVSWYDAVLYCNRRSKRDDRDTVYSFIEIERTDAGDIYRLSGLQINYGNDGYRLPTEAEWIYAAHGGGPDVFIWGNDVSYETADEQSWYDHNSGGTLHPVATRSPNSRQLYDMGGNAIEWVNDVKNKLPGGVITDFTGSRDISLSERVLKGGSFDHNIAYLRVSCRSDEYPVQAPLKNRYTGFRCARGIITSPGLYDDSSRIDSLEPVSLVSGSLLSSVGSQECKFVFVNRSGSRTRTLCYVDYTGFDPEVLQFSAPTDVFNPTISPDGRWVAWCSEDEGSLSGGRVFVRRLSIEDTTWIELPDEPAFVPRWYIDQSTSETWLLYVTSAQLNDQASWSSAQTKMVRFSDGEFIGAPEVVESQGAYHGGRSSDGTYLATGYPFLRMKNLSTDKEKILFSAPQNGKPAGDTSQVCNVSIGPGPAQGDQVLFLDFGSGRDASTLTGTTYHSHEYLFRGEFSGEVLSWYQVPSPYYSWDFTEWSTHANFAVGSAATTNGAHRSIFLIDLEKGTATRLADGTDLYHPYLWIAPGSDTLHTDLAIDSAGQYDSPHLSNPQALQAYKMRLFWHFAESLDVVFVGSSVAADGIDPRYFTGLKGVNLAVGAGDLATSMLLIKNYIFNHCPNVKVIGMSFDMNYFFYNGAYINLYPTFIQGKGYLYDKSHDFWKDGLPPRFEYLVNAVPEPDCGPPPSQIDSLGLMRFSCQGWGPEPPPYSFNQAEVTFGDIYNTNMNDFKNTLEACFDRDIKVLLTVFPTHPGYRNTIAYGPMGPTRTAYEKMADEMERYAEDHPEFVFFDANAEEVFDYSSEEFFDHGHLCVDGAARFSTRIDSVLHVMIDE